MPRIHCPNWKIGQQVNEDVVVVARVQCDFVLASAIRQSSGDIECVVTVEWSHFDCNDVFDFQKLGPEVIVEESAANGWLQIKSKKRKDLGNFRAMVQNLWIRSLPKRSQTQQACIVTKLSRQGSFSKRLLRWAAEASDFHELTSVVLLVNLDCVGSQTQDGFEQPDLRIVNRKLRGVHSHSHPAGAGVAVIAGERHLVALVQLAIAP